MVGAMICVTLENPIWCAAKVLICILLFPFSFFYVIVFLQLHQLLTGMHE